MVKMEPITWIVLALGLLVGGGAGAGITAKLVKNNEPTVVIDNSAATVQAETAQALSDLDLIEPLCVAEYVSENGDGLCRELFCWAQTNSTTGEANGVACEAISNLNNTQTILAVCEIGTATYEDCLDAFRERK